MKYLIITYFICIGIHSQTLGQSEIFYLTIVNSENKTVKEIRNGDQVRIKQFDSRLVKGRVTLIDEFNLIIDTISVSLIDIEKVSTKKSWSQGVGGVLLAGGMGLITAAAVSGSPRRNRS
jgi:small nuclear ribonucleoprotein (snRNP)-like protein